MRATVVNWLFVTQLDRLLGEFVAARRPLKQGSRRLRGFEFYAFVLGYAVCNDGALRALAQRLLL
jgi:hypothetical protein